MGSAYNTTDLTVSRSWACPTRELKADFSACYRPSSLYQNNTNTPKQSWVAPEQHLGKIRGCQWTCCSCSPSRRPCQGQTVCGKQCLQQRGFQPEHLGCAATESFGTFPHGQPALLASKTEMQHKYLPFKGLLLALERFVIFGSLRMGCAKGKGTSLLPLPHCSHARPSHNVALNKKAQMCPVGT